jgi:hypothetical protein
MARAEFKPTDEQLEVVGRYGRKDEAGDREAPDKPKLTLDSKIPMYS